MSAADAETRRALVAAEIGRTSFHDDDPAAIASIASVRALEGARIALQLGLQKVSLDTLRALADLRKAVSDEAAKLSESVRQLAGSVTGALFTGIAVSAARLSLSSTFTSASAVFSVAVACVAVVLSLYVGTMIWGGYRFLSLQRSLRSGWQSRLYRYLPQNEYEQLVETPARFAERTFRIAAWLSAFTTVLLFIGMQYVAFPQAFSDSKDWISNSFD